MWKIRCIASCTSVPSTNGSSHTSDPDPLVKSSALFLMEWHMDTSTSRKSGARVVRASRGTELSCKSWLSEAPFRMLQNNLDPEVAENPAELVVYGGIGRAARNWECFDAILRALRELRDDETLLVQSGKPVGVFPTHENAPR